MGQQQFWLRVFVPENVYLMMVIENDSEGSNSHIPIIDKRLRDVVNPSAWG